MRIAAWQAPLLAGGSMAALDMIRGQVRRCEAEGVELLLCPEAVLGGLADDTPDPSAVALSMDDLAAALRPLASPTVATVVGFSEAREGRLHNAAALYAGGEVLGVYRKRHPARRVSVYAAGTESPVFALGHLRFGMMICNDTNFPELADDLTARGAQLLLVPSNNALRAEIADVAELTRGVDVATARRCGIPVVRADVAGRTETRVAFGTSAIVGARGEVIAAGEPFAEQLLIADLDV